MPNVDRCPHCEKEITQENVRNALFYRQFKETGACKALFRTARRCLFAALIVVITSVFVDAFFKVNIAGRELDLIMWLGMLVGLILLGVAFHRTMHKEERLFEEFKKSQSAQ